MVLSIMFYSYYNKAPEGTAPVCKTFLHLAAFAQQLRSSGPPLGHTVKSASNNAANYLSHMASERGILTGKFNFGVGVEGGVGGSGGIQVGEATRYLFQLGSESLSELSEF